MSESKVFRSGLTKQASLLGAAPLTVAVLLLRHGFYYMDKFPDAATLALFSYLPILFGLGIVGFAVYVVSKNTGKTVTVTPVLIAYEHGGEKFAVRWELLAFAGPPADKKFMRGLSISDGSNFTRIEELFFPEFDKLYQVILAAKKGRR